MIDIEACILDTMKANPKHWYTQTELHKTMPDGITMSDTVKVLYALQSDYRVETKLTDDNYTILYSVRECV